MLGFLSFSGLTQDQPKKLSNIEIRIPDFGQIVLELACSSLF